MGEAPAPLSNAIRDLHADGAVALLALSSLGLTCSLPVLIANTLIARLRRPPARFVRARASLSAAQAACLGAFALHHIHHHHHPPSSSSLSSCAVPPLLLLAAETFDTAIGLCLLGQALHLFSIVRDPFRPKRHLTRLTILICALTAAEPTAVAVAAAAHSSAATGGCVAAEHALATLLSLRSTLCAVDVVLVLLSVGCAVRMLARLRSGLGVSSVSRARVSKQLLIYILGYSFIDLILALLKGLGALNSTTIEVGLATAGARGVWDLCIWLSANSDTLRGRCFKPSSPVGRHSAAAGAADRGGAADGGRGRLLQSVADDSSSRDVAEELRSELVLLTAHGIARCVEARWQKAVTAREATKRGQAEAPAPRRGGLQSKRRAGGGVPAGRCDIELTVVGGGGGDGGGGGGGGDGVAVPDGREASHSLSVTAVSHSGGLHPALSVPGLDQKHMDFFDYGTELCKGPCRPRHRCNGLRRLLHRCAVASVLLRQSARALGRPSRYSLVRRIRPVLLLHTGQAIRRQDPLKAREARAALPRAILRLTLRGQP